MQMSSQTKEVFFTTDVPNKNTVRTNELHYARIKEQSSSLPSLPPLPESCLCYNHSRWMVVTWPGMGIQVVEEAQRTEWLKFMLKQKGHLRADSQRMTEWKLNRWGRKSHFRLFCLMFLLLEATASSTFQ